MENHIGVYYQTVEKAIKTIGLDPVKTRVETGRWTLNRNGIPVWLFLNYQTNAKGYYFQVAAPILKMPTENRGAFCEQLLSLNGQLFGVAFIEKGGTVYLNTIREILDLDVSEAYAMIVKVGNYADYYTRSMKNGLLNWTSYSSAGPNKAGEDSLTK